MFVFQTIPMDIKPRNEAGLPLDGCCGDLTWPVVLGGVTKSPKPSELVFVRKRTKDAGPDGTVACIFLACVRHDP